MRGKDYKRRMDGLTLRSGTPRQNNIRGGVWDC